MTLAADRRARVLCVDDDAFMLDILTRTIGVDYEVVTARSGAEALQLIENSEPIQVVISDHRMPGLSGAQFLQAVREQHLLIVRVLLTGETDLVEAVAAMNQAALFRFLIKPGTRPLMLDTLRAAVALKEAIREKLRSIRIATLFSQGIEITSITVVQLHPSARPIHQAEHGRRRGASLIHELAENGNRSPIVPRSIGGDSPGDSIGLALKRVYLIDTGKQQEEHDAANMPRSDFHMVALGSTASVGKLILQSLLPSRAGIRGVPCSMRGNPGHQGLMTLCGKQIERMNCLYLRSAGCAPSNPAQDNHVQSAVSQKPATLGPSCQLCHVQGGRKQAILPESTTIEY